MLRELKTFITVARLGTFAAAGQQVGLTQSAVSAQMRVLEQHLGVRSPTAHREAETAKAHRG